MPRIQALQPSFNSGELTPRLVARLDFARYPSGLDTSENLILLPEGGVMRRSGTRFVSEIKSSAVKGRLKTFQFSTQQAYILEMGDQVLRFYRHQGKITVADTDAVVTNGTFPTDITGWDDRSTGLGSIAHDAINLDLNLIPGGTGGTDIGWAEQSITTTNTGQEHVLKFRVVGAPGDKIEFQVGVASLGAQTLGPVEKETGYHCVAFTPTSSPFFIQFRNLGATANKTISIDDISLIDNVTVEIDTPWLEASLFNVEGPQSADVLYLFHETTSTHKLQRFGHTTWSLVEVAWQDGPYGDLNLTATTLTPSATTGVAITVTASVVTGINGGQGFLVTDIGRLVRIDNGTAWGWGIIVGHTSTTVVTVHVKKAFAAATATTDWRLGSWSTTTGYAQLAVFFEQRLYSAASTDQPQTIWASQTDDFENNTLDNFADVVEADDAFNIPLSSDTVEGIRWISAGEDSLSIGTSGGEWVPESVGIVLTPLDRAAHKQTAHGSAKIQPVRVGNVVLFLQRAKRKIREFGFVADDNGFLRFSSVDITRLAEHITRGGIIEMGFAEEPNSLVWSIRNDGQLLSLTFIKDEDIGGWGRHIIGGSFNTGNSIVESNAVIPGDNGAGQIQDSTNRDEVWMIVKRTINGATKRYIEFLERDFETGDAQADAYYADSIITYDGVATTTITGLGHLEGQTVKIWGDGAIRPPKTVTSASITLDVAASKAQIGIPYKHRLKTLKVSSGNPAGTTIGRKKRINELTFVLLNSHTLSFGESTTELGKKDFRLVSDPMDAGAPLFTGEQSFPFVGKWAEDVRIVVESDEPAPFTLLAISPEININPLK